MTSELIIRYLKENPALNISGIEEEAGLPASTLSRVISGSRKLKAEHLELLDPVLRKYGFREENFSDRLARTIAVCLHKGGCSKTISSVNIGKALSLLGYKTLVVDLDPQGNMSQSLGFDVPENQLVHSLLEAAPLPIQHIADRFDLIPSDLELSDAELELVNEIGGFNRLKRLLKSVRTDYDYIILDTPPSLNILTTSAMVAADSILIPLVPEVSAIKGLDTLLKRIYEVKQELNHTLRVEGIFFSIVDARLVVHQEYMEAMKQKDMKGVKIFNSLIRKNVSLTESQSAQQDIFTYDKSSNGAKDYMALAKELIEN